MQNNSGGRDIENRFIGKAGGEEGDGEINGENSQESSPGGPGGDLAVLVKVRYLNWVAKIRARTIEYRARDLEAVWKDLQGGLCQEYIPPGMGVFKWENC